MPSTNSSRAAKRVTPEWPPRYLSKIPAADLKRSRGLDVVDFAEALCKITKDSVAGSAGEPLVFRPWQRSLTEALFAVRPDGRLRHKMALIGMPRKNGKSAWLSAVALEHLVLGPAGGEAYACAADREQAKIVFGTAKRMVELQPELADLLTVTRDAIYNPRTGSTFRALSSEAFTKEGLSPTLVAFDELHAQPNRELFDVMSLAMGARTEPLLVAITTAGVRTDSSGRDSLCYSLYEYGKQVAKGLVDDPSFFFAWWEPKANTDYRLPATWRSANPGFGDIVAEEDFASAMKRTPEAEFKTKRLNVWTSSAETWLPDGAWSKLSTGVPVPDGAEVVLGFDGSFSNDSTALVVCSVAESPHIDTAAVWEKPQDADPDWRVPVADVEDAIRDACRRWSVREIVCDPYRWGRTYQVLEAEGLPIVEFPQSPQRMVPATSRFYEAVLNGSITHGGDPAMARHMDNCELKTDARGSRLSKGKNASRKIDLAVAAVMAHARASFLASAPAEFEPFILF